MLEDGDTKWIRHSGPSVQGAESNRRSEHVNRQWTTIWCLDKDRSRISWKARRGWPSALRSQEFDRGGDIFTGSWRLYRRWPVRAREKSIPNQGKQHKHTERIILTEHSHIYHSTEGLRGLDRQILLSSLYKGGSWGPGHFLKLVVAGHLTHV